MNIFARLKYSLTGPKGYLELMKESLPKAFMHLVLLALITTSLLGTTFVFLYNEQQKTIVDNLKLEENNFTYEDGILEYEKGTIKIDEGETLILVDTTKSVSDYEDLRKVIVHKDTAFALTKDGIIVRAMSNEKTIKYSEILPSDLVLDNSSLINSLEEYDYLKYIMVLWIGVVILFNKLYYALIITLLGTLINFMNRTNIKFKNIFKMACYSLTLVTLLELFIPVGSFTVFISGMYVILAMNYIRRIQMENQNM